MVASCSSDDDSQQRCEELYTRLNDVPFADARPNGAFVVNQTPYLWIEDSNNRSVLYSYNVSADSWQEVSLLPTEQQAIGDIFCYVIDGMVYCAFAVNFNIDVLMWQFDPTDGSWSERTGTNFIDSGIFDRLENGFTIDGIAYLYADSGGDNFRSYDPETDQWTIRAQLPPSDVFNRTGFVVGNRAYMMGGECGLDCYTGGLRRYDPIADEWELLPLPFPDRIPIVRGSFVIDDMAYVLEIGRIVNGQSEGDLSLLRFDDQTESWEDLGKCLGMKGGRFQFSAGNKGYMGLPFGPDDIGSLYQINP